MRLIDADSLFESIRDCIFDTTSIEMRRAEHLVKSHICELIEKQPTAYDVDKVIEKLHEIQYEDECREVSLVVEVKEAETIIRTGGIE